ncbi:MAG: hypothetical protein Ct9H300mP4_13680 [Gammaproteobacteria bacterium]|nr:MAG: hypothetical protein Ct9H300mP4_13680 [Gammaproteobacteria bacterium]
MSQISIRQGEDYQSFESSNLPIKIGTDLNADIRILGPLSIGVVLLIDSLDGRPFIQVVNEKMEVLINDQLLSGNHRINNEDRIDVADKSIAFELSGDNELTLTITSNEDSLQPTQFQKKTAGTTIFSSRVFKYSATALILGLTYFLFYLFTANAILIKLQPVGSEVNISGGYFPHLKIGGRYLLRQGNYQLDVAYPGYYPLSAAIAINADSSQEIGFGLEKLPGELMIKTSPESDFVVSVDGNLVQPAVAGVFIIAAGEHKLRIIADRYFTVEQDILIDGMELTQEIEVTLTPAWAEISIQSLPTGANILIDGKPSGISPNTLEVLEGEHTMVLNKSGYKPFEQSLVVKASQPQFLDSIELSRLDSKLKVTTNPNGAAVNINSIYQGLSPVIVELPPLKPHVVEVSKPGYQTQTEEIILPTSEEIQANGTKDFLQIETNLKPIKGFIRVIGTEGASILADGKQIAQIPSTIELLAKAQTLIVQKEGYVTQEINIQPTPGYEQNLNIRLLTPEEAVLAAMPEYIETSLGLQMRLVSSGTFVMGTPRGDQGRRQGETERLIKITRPFYVGVREIINKEFRQFKPRHTSGAETFRELSNGLHPAVMLTWEEAVDFCQKLSSKESLEPAYEKINGQYQLIQPVTNGYRLLTEAEWEWVARFNGGAGKQRYPWGESMPVKPESGNYADESVEGLDLVANTLSNYWDGYPVTSPAQKFSPNALGIYDLGGNVAEWVNDYYSVYSTNLKQAELDPLGPDEGGCKSYSRF